MNMPMAPNNSARSVTVEEMSNGEGLKFGKGYLCLSRLIEWNPDSWQTKNPHALITGTSGAGKTTLLREVIRYLANRNKFVFVVDLHGDLQVPGLPENYIEITARNSKYGINPFEFEKCPKNGGINVQADTIIQLFKKTFMPNLGSLQAKVLKKIVVDTYEKAGIFDNDVKTWDRPLPTMEDMKTLVDAILARVSTGLHYDFIAKFERCSKKITNSEYKKEILKRYSALLGENESVPQLDGKIDEETDQIDKDIPKLDEMWKEFRNAKIFSQPLGDIFGDDLNVDLEFYSRKDVVSVVDTLAIYITTLFESKVFSATPPPLSGKGSLHRFDISGLDHNIQLFFCDVLLAKVFRAKKMRGEYSNNPDKSRGERTDTYVVIDESKLVMPQGKEKENPYQSINRIASESRKYGLGLVLASQKPTHYPEELLTNIDLKVVLTTAGLDKKPAMRLLGIKDQTLFTYTDKFGVAIISMGSGDFEPVSLPWCSSN